MKIQSEYTTRATPQHNHLEELKLAFLAKKGRALMIEANVPIKLCYKVFSKAIYKTTLTYGLTSITIDGNKPTWFEHLFGENPTFLRFLRTWGEAGTVKIKTATTDVVQPKTYPCYTQHLI